jgi:hypothetical protein
LTNADQGRSPLAVEADPLTRNRPPVAMLVNA